MRNGELLKRRFRVTVDFAGLTRLTFAYPFLNIAVNVWPNISGFDELDGRLRTGMGEIVQLIESTTTTAWWEVRTRNAGRCVAPDRQTICQRESFKLVGDCGLI